MHCRLYLLVMFLILSSPARSEPPGSGVALGLGVEGPMLGGVAASLKFNQTMTGRLLVASDSFKENIQVQLLYYWSPARPNYLLFAAGDVDRERYLRFAIGRDWDIGRIRINGSLGFNILDFNDDNGLDELINRIAAFQIFGFGAHYLL